MTALYSYYINYALTDVLITFMPKRPAYVVIYFS